MGDLEVDTQLDGGNGHWTVTLDPSWEIWGPCGGYIAALLLRTAGAHSAFPRPASLAVNFLGVAAFAPVELHAETLQAGRRSECVRVSMTQEGRPISHAVVWTMTDPDGREGIEYDWTERPDVPGPQDLKSLDELTAELDIGPSFPFWENLECRPTAWLPPEEWESKRPTTPALSNWYRFRPTAVFDDPYVEAARVTMICDLIGWPSVVRALEPGLEQDWIAPNVDVNVTFHQPPAGSAFLHLDGAAPIATGGTIGGHARVWSEDGRLLASSIQQMLTRPVRRD